MSYEQWQRYKSRLKEFELAAEARRVLALIDSGEMGAVSHEELIQLIAQKRGHGSTVGN